MIKKLGLQLYTIRSTMDTAENIRASFKKLRELGYEVGQTAGCAIDYVEYGKIAKEEGIEICGTHDNYDIMVNDIDRAIANHKALGTTNMGIGGCNAQKDGVAGVEKFIEQANKIADRAYEEGMKFTYHNHSHEFMRLPNGKTMMEMLVEGLDPKKTSFVLDTYWVQHGGADIRRLIERLSGRIDILHLKDMAAYHPETKAPYYTQVGDGNIDMKDIVAHAENHGVKYFVVEQDGNFEIDSVSSIKKSFDFLKANVME